MKKSSDNIFNKFMGLIVIIAILSFLVQFIGSVLVLALIGMIVVVFIVSKLSKTPTEESGKYFHFMTCDSRSEVPPNKWYRLERWQRPNYLKMETEKPEDWKMFSTEETVVGVTQDSRKDNFLLMGDQDDFKVFLEREKDNPVDPNAIKVMGSATVEGSLWVRQLGYLSKETAAKLKDEEDLNARPHSVFLPYEDKMYGLKVSVLVRYAKYKKKMKKHMTKKSF